MATQLIRCRYTAEGFKGMLTSPSDRGAAIEKLFGALNMNVSQVYFSTSTCELYILCESSASDVQLTAAEMIVMGTGAVTDVQVMNLIDSKTVVEAMTMGGKISGHYKAPSAS
jgi:uncharacterized protein with GYD domain